MASPERPWRGDVWIVDLDQPVGHESGLRRPGLVVTANEFNRFGLVSVVPITSTRKAYPTRVGIRSADSGLAHESYAQVEQVRTISTQRLTHRIGRADATELAEIERVLRYLFAL